MAKKMTNTPPKPVERVRYEPLKIRAWRKYRRMTLEQLAALVDTSPSALSMLERGERGYTQDTLEAIAKALQTDVPSLFLLDPARPEAIWQWLASLGQKGTFTPE